MAALGLWAERTRWGGRLSGMVIALLGTFALANARVIPPAAPLYDLVWAYLVPLAIPLLLLRADLRRILRESGPTLLAFAAGTVGTVAGTLVAFALVPLGAEGWKLAGIFCATYVGGSMNYVAVARTVGLRSSDLLAAGVAADNLVMAAYFLVLFALPSVGFLARRYPARAEPPSPARATGALGGSPEGGGPAALDMATALGLSAAICAAGFAVEAAVGVRGAGILLITAGVVTAATLAPRRIGGIRGADTLGMYLMQVFFATIGASAHVGTVLRVGASLFLFAAVILTVHLAVILGAGRLMRLDLSEIVIASNANLGGPTTAAAMAAARRWQRLVVPAILCGTLGYSVANFIGVGVAYWLR